MGRHVLACHTGQSRPSKIVAQDGGPMPECRDLQTGVIGYYEFIEVASINDVQRALSQVELMTIVLSVVLSAFVTVAIVLAHSRLGFLRLKG